jgi:hypothetical protein
MGINLAIEILDGRLKTSPHGGLAEAINELMRESLWMTDEEVEYVISIVNKDSDSQKRLLIPVMQAELQTRRKNSDVGYRSN